MRRRRGEPGRVSNLLTFVCGAGLLTALGCLHLMGRPGLALQSLWVYDHRQEVRIGLTGLTVAVIATAVGLSVQRGRMPLLILWLGAIAAAGSVFPDRLSVIATVLLNHYL